MSEFIWKTYRIECREITRGEHLHLWQDMVAANLIGNSDMPALEWNERIAEIITVVATVGVYEGKKKLKAIGEIPLPISAGDFNALPASLATGWIRAALAENPIDEVVSFPSQRRLGKESVDA